MQRSRNGLIKTFVLALVMASSASQGHAHFLWLKTIDVEEKPHAFLFFGEDSTDEAYHMPESIASAKIWRRTGEGPREALATEPLESDERIGLVAPLGENAPCVLETSQQYGVYGDWLLTYHAKHVRALSNEDLAAVGRSKELKLDVVPRARGEELELVVLWEGKPLGDAEVSVAVGDDAVEKKTDTQGIVTLTLEGDGLVAVLANYKDASVSGKSGDQEYKTAAHFTSLTFNWRAAKPRAAANSLPVLPEPLASFGAVVADGWLYVYGGHIGTEHDHSAANLSKHFQRIRIDGSEAEWESLPMQTPLQGLPLVAHEGKIYRIGGMSARNATPDETEDIHSSDEFAAFDPATQKWTALAPLPAPRSSHNAVVIDGKLYVVGGWTLGGSSPGEWQPDALVYDVKRPDAGWRPIAEPPFKRRALAVGHWQGKLVVLGGMDEDGKVSQKVYFYEPESKAWSKGPRLPGAGVAGFGVSAWNLEGELYVSGMGGIVYRLNEAGARWEEAAHLETPRFFHQLVPAVGGGLLAIGGASSDGHLAEIEWVNVGAQRERLGRRAGGAQ